jgi:NTE family protein
VALGSGAARGWAHIGVLRALAAHGIEPEIVCGTSIGAVVGAAYAAGRLDPFERWVRKLEWREIVSHVGLSFRGGLLDPRGLFAFFEEALAGRSLEDLDRPFAAVGTDLASGAEVWMREGDLVTALRASIALPGLITPARWQGRWTVDGGLVNPVPVSLCRALGADSVIAVDLNTMLLGRRRWDAKPTSVASVSDEPLDGQVALGDRVNALVRDLAADIRERLGLDGRDTAPMPTLYEVMANSVNIMQVRIGRSRMAGDPPELLVAPRMADFAILDFDRAEEAIDEGRRAVARTLAGLEDDDAGTS